MKYIFTFLMLHITFMSIGQEGWHRLYETDLADTLIVHQDGASIDNETYVMMNYGFSTDGVAERLFITKLDKKGNIEASYRISPPEDLAIEEFSGGNIIYNTESGQVVFSFVGKTAEEYRMYIGSMSQGGADLVVTQIDSEALDLSDSPFIQNIQYADNNTLLIDDGSSSYSLVTLGADLSFRSSAVFSVDDHALNAMSNDTTFLSETLTVGTFDSDDENGLFYAKVDDQGSIVSGKKYTDLSTAYSNVNVLSRVDGGMYISAQTAENGVLIAVDTIGDVLWSKEIMINGLPTFASSLSANGNNSVIIGGTYDNAGTLQHFTINIDADGKPINASQYQNNEAIDGLQNVSVDYNLASGGYYLSGNSINETDTVITLMSHTSMDSIMCSTLLEIDTFQNISLDTDTLIINKDVELTTLTDIDFTNESVQLFTIPELSISADQRRFCPDEEVNELLTASVSIAPANTVSYLWETGETTDTIRGTETDVNYVVTATVNYQECFSMCDTIQLQRYPAPMLSISQAKVSNCEWVLNGAVQNLGGLKGGSVTYQWSTGETSQTINVGEGSYSLTVTDQCGQEASASITLSNTTIAAEIIVLENNNCEDATLGVEVINISDNMGYQWSTGETTSTINVTEPGNYSVTVTDLNCNFTATDNYNFEIAEPLTDFNINTDVIVCEEIEPNVYSLSGLVEVTADGDFEKVTITTPEGNTVESSIIDVIQSGVYTVTVTDLCGNVITKTFDTSGLCPCVAYPKVFFPDGVEEAPSELTFGPVFLMGCENVTISEDGYELKVFNRWGQEVFSTTDPTEFWDGKFNDEDAPSEVYVYYAIYKLEGEDEENVVKGDVTIIR